MPELPEIEHLRRSLEPVLTGAIVKDVRLHRLDVARRVDNGRIRRHDLLRGGTVAELSRLGKNLLFHAADGRGVRIHLGMTGRLLAVPPRKRIDPADHVHCVWRVVGADCQTWRIAFRDPRRFGGIVAAPTRDAMGAFLAPLGPDALAIDENVFTGAVQRSRRAIKSILLDQTVLAGVGNIYADEALFRAKVHPSHRGIEIGSASAHELLRQLRAVLGGAINARGSTLRDYVDANGLPGEAARLHQVYGRAGAPCVACETFLEAIQVGQRTTVVCPSCQALPAGCGHAS